MSASQQERQREASAKLPALRRESSREDTALASRTLALVLSGGRGSRLANLTDWRAKPAVPFAGRFRIIDFTLSNCVHSGIRRIAVLTQYKAQSLIRHLQQGWSFLDRRVGEFVELLPAQQRLHTAWYAGTADAVFQNLDFIRREAPAFILVLAGDHIYKMDYRALIADHVAREAELTVACVERPAAESRAFGVMEATPEDRIIGFQEKPRIPRALAGRPDRILASMGVYVFDTAFLLKELARDAHDVGSSHDFGGDLIPHLVRSKHRVYAHRFDRARAEQPGTAPYWRDVGTVDAYWQANIELTAGDAPLDLGDADWPILTAEEQLPPARFLFDDEHRSGVVSEALVANGCVVSGSEIRRSVLFSNVRVNDYCRIEESVLLPSVEVGVHCTVKRAVVDKYCKLPPGLTVGVNPEDDRRRFHVTAGGVTLITLEMLGQRAHEGR